jgi:hypothetical protein
MKIEMETNLWGQPVLSEKSRAALSKRYDQATLPLNNELTDELKRERRLAQAHRAKGGKELFQG